MAFCECLVGTTVSQSPLVQASVTVSVLLCFGSGNQKCYSINYVQKANLAYLTAFVQR